ncbi:MAG: anthranilate synthase component I family protein, partial [Chitinophagaceae bacterium]|nr:anthranilate synthase component I family protein [Chitinophagaceae bacterium]
MKKIEISTSFKKLLADVFTPVGIYLRLRDRFRDTILLESTDFHAGENSYSFIGINAIAGIEIINPQEIEFKLPGKNPEKIKIDKTNSITTHLGNFMQLFQVKEVAKKPVSIAQGLFGYTTYDAIQFFDAINLSASKVSPLGGDLPTGQAGLEGAVPLMRYRLYQYVIAVNHFKDELFICENHISNIISESDVVESLIKSKDVPTYSFKIREKETSSITDTEYIEMVKKGITSCH